MSNKWASNYGIPSSTNVFATIWQLTREMKAAGWAYKASGVAGSTTSAKDTSGIASSDLWGGNANPEADSYSNNSTTYSGSTVSLPQGSLSVNANTLPSSGSGSIFTDSGWQNISWTGGGGGGALTGVTGGTGQIRSGYPIVNGSNTIGLDNVAAWIVLSGPKTIRIPMAIAPTGVPLRGETITQATSGAEGELVGFVFDSVGGSGWFVVLPHTGTFDNTHTVTGSTSGATFSPTGTIITYEREVMFYKDTGVLQGAIFYGAFDNSFESAQLFSALATASGCVGNVGPGQGGTSNAFPAAGIVVRGTANSTSVGTWFGMTTSFQTNAQIIATNCTPGTGVSADGTFWLAITNAQVTNSCAGFGFLRLDDTEPGDPDPFVFMTSANTENFSSATNSSTKTGGGASQQFAFYGQNLRSGSTPYFLGNQARGNGSLDTYNAYTLAPRLDSFNNTIEAISGTNNLGNPIRVVNSPATTRPLVLEPCFIYSVGSLSSVSGVKPQYKGRCRWLLMSSIGNTYDTFASKTLLGVSVAATGGNAPCFVIGPYDGATTPVQ